MEGARCVLRILRINWFSNIKSKRFKARHDYDELPAPTQENRSSRDKMVPLLAEHCNPKEAVHVEGSSWGGHCALYICRA